MKMGEADLVLFFYHINFHTARNVPVFEIDDYDQMMRACLPTVLDRHTILCPAWEIMPTHVHLICAAFPDLALSTIVKRIKGATSHAFFATYPLLRADLQGGHLWTRSYYFVSITSHRQYVATLEYIRSNRTNAGLLTPPAPLLLQE